MKTSETVKINIEISVSCRNCDADYEIYHVFENSDAAIHAEVEPHYCRGEEEP